MPLSNRNDLGRLYLSTRNGPTGFAYMGDGAVDGLASATTVSMVGSGTMVSPKAWTGTVSARPSPALVAAASTTDPVDLLVLYGAYCDIIRQTNYNEAVLIEGVVFSADQYTALTALTSAARAVITSTHTFAAEAMLRIPATTLLTKLKSFAGAVVAICAEGARVYALIAFPLGEGAITLSLAWTDAITAGLWNTAALDGSFVEPTAYGETWAQASMVAFNNQVYISTAVDFIVVDRPAVGIDTLYPAAVRTAIYAPYGDPDQLCRIVGMYAEGDLLYVGTKLGQIWRVAASGTVLARSLGGTTNWAFAALDGGDLALVDAATIRVITDGGRQFNLSGWTGNARYICGGLERYIVATADGKLYAGNGVTWNECWDFGAPLITMTKASYNLFYAITASGTQGSQVWVSVSGGQLWSAIGEVSDALYLHPLADGKCLVGCQTLAPLTSRASGPASILAAATGYIAGTAPSEQLIVS